MFYNENIYILRTQCFTILSENAACQSSFQNSARKHGAIELSSENTGGQHPSRSPEAHLEPSQTSMIEHFFRKQLATFIHELFLKKHSVIDVRVG